MVDWPWVRLSALAVDEKSAISKPYGSAIVRQDYVADGVPVVRGVNLGNGRFRDDDFVYITEELADTMPGSRLQPGDLVFTHRGSIGQVAMIPRHPRYDRYAVSTSQVKARLDPGKALPEFYCYWFQSPEGKRSILQGVSTVGVPGLARPVETVKALRVPMPPLPEQQRIAEVLGAFDDLIETNQHLADCLVLRARADYKKTLARDWPAIPFSDTIDIISGGTPKTSRSEYWGGEIPWYSVVDAPQCVTPWVTSTSKMITTAGLENSAARLLPPGTTIMSARGTVGKLALAGVPMAMNQSCYGLRSRVGVRGIFTYFAAEDVVSALRQSAHGSVFDTITRESYQRVTVPVPERSVIEAFEDRTWPLFKLALELELEIAELTRTRDELLPLLMSGRVRVREVA